jgi:hypothetical protein
MKIQALKFKGLKAWRPKLCIRTFGTALYIENKFLGAGSGQHQGRNRIGIFDGETILSHAVAGLLRVTILAAVAITNRPTILPAVQRTNRDGQDPQHLHLMKHKEKKDVWRSEALDQITGIAGICICICIYIYIYSPFGVTLPGHVI